MDLRYFSYFSHISRSGVTEWVSYLENNASKWDFNLFYSTTLGNKDLLKIPGQY